MAARTMRGLLCRTSVYPLNYALLALVFLAFHSYEPGIRLACTLGKKNDSQIFRRSSVRFTLQLPQIWPILANLKSSAGVQRPKKKNHINSTISTATRPLLYSPAFRTYVSQKSERVCQIRRYIYPLNYALLALVLLAFHSSLACLLPDGVPASGHGRSCVGKWLWRV